MYRLRDYFACVTRLTGIGVTKKGDGSPTDADVMHHVPEAGCAVGITRFSADQALPPSPSPPSLPMLRSTTALRPTLLKSTRLVAKIRNWSPVMALATPKQGVHGAGLRPMTVSLALTGRSCISPPPPPSSPKRAVDSSNLAPDPNPAKFAHDDRRPPAMIASEQLQKDGKGVEGRHFTDEPAAIISLRGFGDYTGDWTLTHPAYSEEALEAVKVVHRPSVTLSDKVAHKLVKTLR